MPVDVLAQDDRVVDDQAQRHDECEERHHVDRHADPDQYQESAEKRDRDAGGNPHGEARSQEQGEHQQDQHQALTPVAQQQVASALELPRLVEPDRDVDALGHARPRGGDVAPHRAGNVEDVLLLAGKQSNHHRRFPVQSNLLVALGEAVHHPSDVSQIQSRAVVARPQDDRLELGAAIDPGAGANEDLACTRLEGAAGEIDGRGTYGPGNVVETEAVAAEIRFRNLDGDLVGAHADQLRSRHRGQGCDLVADAFAQLMQRRVVGVAVDGDGDQDGVIEKLLNNGFLRLDRQRLQSLDPRLDLFGHPPCVGAYVELSPDDSEPLAGSRGKAVDAAKAMDRLFDADTDGSLDFVWSRTRVLHSDGDHIEGDVGHGFLAQTRNAEKTRGHDEQHQQVGRHAVPGEPGDQAVHGPSPTRGSGAEAPSDSSAARIRTRVPARAPSAETSTRSPPARPSPTSTRSSVNRRISTLRARSRPSASTTITSDSGRRAERGSAKIPSRVRPEISASTKRPTVSGSWGSAVSSP